MSSPHVVHGITGIPQRMETIHCPVDIVANFDLPATLTPADLRKVEKDLEIKGNLVRHHPRELCHLYQAVVEGRLADAVRMGRKLGLDEDHFVAAGGGQGWEEIVAGILIVVMLGNIIGGAIHPGGGDVDPHTESGETDVGEGEGEGEVAPGGPPNPDATE
jgi:hypothetical protein